TETLHLTSNDVLLVNACGSAIGRILAQLSRVIGFQLIAVTRNDLYTKALLQLGASHVIDTSKDSVYEQVMDITNGDRKSTRLNSSHVSISYAVFCLKKKRICNHETHNS